MDPNIKRQAFLRWLKDNHNDKTEPLRINYNLNEDSVVFDLGGYKGDWANLIYKKYNCSIHIFEPIPPFNEYIEERFKGLDKIKVYKYGLSVSNRTEQFSIANDSTSSHIIGSNKVSAELKDIVPFINRNIDIMKINIEGEEFPLLEHIINSGVISNIDNIQVQFHDFVDNAIIKRDNIRSKLTKTHTLTYDYPFIWENWKRK